MNKINYQKELEKLIEFHVKSGKIPSLLLHSCCAPCSSYVLEYLSDYFYITVLYYNPNISPLDEYQTRVEEQKRLIEELPVKNPIHFLEGEYRPQEFYQAVKGYEQEPEGGERCTICYDMRLREAAKYAQKGGFDYFTTTLTISPLKNAEKLNRLGQEIAKEYQVQYLPSDFKKKQGYIKSVELSTKYHLYRQNFCGCVFSRNEAEQ